MIIDIDVQETVGGDLFIKELPDATDGYAETEDEAFEKDSVCFKDSASVTVLKRHTSESITEVKAFIHDHSSTDVVNKFKISEDGWYEVAHFVIPNAVWFAEAEERETLSNYEKVYITTGGKLYEYVEEGFLEVDEMTVIENAQGSNIWLIEKDAFILYDLWQCYLKYAREVLDREATFDSSCGSDCNVDGVKERDLLWVFLNAIQYMVKLGDMEKAEAFRAKLSTCGGLCSNVGRNYDCNCGR